MSKATLQPTLQRRPLVKQLLKDANDDLLVIAGLGSSNWDITAAGDRPLNMPLWGAMGAPVAMGLGLALAQPTRRVLVITGDGDMLMSLGSLATVATQQPENEKSHFCGIRARSSSESWEFGTNKTISIG